VTPEPPAPAGLEPEDVPFETVYEDESVVVVNKPPGVVVHPGSGQASGTLAAGLLFRYPDVEGVGAPSRWGLVHRLDRDTSGVLLVARTKHAYESLTTQLSRREITRVYLALVHGTFHIPTGTVEAPIGRDPARPTRRAVVPGGKDAATHYEVLAEYPSHDVSFLEVRLETGRTHQIRVHMSAIEHPVVGDRTYSSKPARVTAPRVFLHAHRVSFRHPVTEDLVVVEAPLPGDLQDVLSGITE
jgi:23S rRNA pseudouridine1911/1915/1917 synthase